MLLCSRNARPRKALVGRAQREHNRRPRYFSSSDKEGRKERATVASGGKLCPALFGDGGLCFRPSAYHCTFSSDEGEGSGEDNLLAERARSECARSTRAIGSSPDALPIPSSGSGRERGEESDERVLIILFGLSAA